MSLSAIQASILTRHFKTTYCLYKFCSTKSPFSFEQIQIANSCREEYIWSDKSRVHKPNGNDMMWTTITFS